MLNYELVGYIQFIKETALIEKLKLSFSRYFYSNNAHLKDIKVTVLWNRESWEIKHHKIMLKA